MRRKDSLVRHTRNVHSNAILTKKRKYLDQSDVSDDNTTYPPLQRSDNDDWRLNQAPGFTRDEPLHHSDSVPDWHPLQPYVSKESASWNQHGSGMLLETKANNLMSNEKYFEEHQIQFKHPFSMMLAGSRRTGKTHFSKNILLKNHAHRRGSMFLRNASRRLIY